MQSSPQQSIRLSLGLGGVSTAGGAAIPASVEPGAFGSAAVESLGGRDGPLDGAGEGGSAIASGSLLFAVMR